MSDLLSNGTSGLLAFQRALTTTSQNIANVNTEGYSRQRVNLDSVVSNPDLLHQPGSGVRVADIERLQDEFATGQVLLTNSTHARHATHLNMTSRIDNFMADDALSMTPAMNNLFAALEDANADPASPASREIVLEQVNQVSNRFQALQQQFDGLQLEVNDRSRADISDINELATGIAELNQRIVSASGRRRGDTPNELLDQRDQLIQQLSTRIDVQTLDQADGARNIFIGNGISLVAAGSTQTLRTQSDDLHPDQLKIEVGQNDQWQNVTPQLAGGSLGGLRDFERSTLSAASHQLGRLALTVADAFNSQQSQGIDLEGNPGAALFTHAVPVAVSNAQNTGSATITATLDTVGELEPSDYLLRFDGSTFSTTRLSDGQSSSGSMPVTIDGLTIDLTGSPATGDSFLISATGRVAGTLNSESIPGSALALASPISSSSALSNPGDSTLGPIQILDASQPALSTTVDIVFTADDQFDVIDVDTGINLQSNVAYTPGTTVQANGWELTINGQASAGDTHHVRPNTDGRGDNTNGLALARLQQSTLVDGTQSLNDAYGSLVSSIGGQTRSLQMRSSASENVRTSAIERQQSIQGVNLDEEAVNLTRYQQAYQASAQVIATADTLFQTILGVVAR